MHSINKSWAHTCAVQRFHMHSCDLLDGEIPQQGSPAGQPNSTPQTQHAVQLNLSPISYTKVYKAVQPSSQPHPMQPARHPDLMLTHNSTCTTHSCCTDGLMAQESRCKQPTAEQQPASLTTAQQKLYSAVLAGHCGPKPAQQHCSAHPGSYSCCCTAAASAAASQCDCEKRLGGQVPTLRPTKNWVPTLPSVCILHSCRVTMVSPLSSSLI